MDTNLKLTAEVKTQKCLQGRRFLWYHLLKSHWANGTSFQIPLSPCSNQTHQYKMAVSVFHGLSLALVSAVCIRIGLSMFFANPSNFKRSYYLGNN